MQTLVLPAIEIPDTTRDTPLGALRVPGLMIPERMVVIDPAVIRDMITKARLAADLGYNNMPAAVFRVGAAVIMADDPEGTLFTAANSEMGVLNAGICAERALLHYVVAQGFRRIKMLAVSTPHRAKDAISLRSPCGLCRQTIAEFADDDTLVIIDHQADGVLGDVLDINRLLPYRYRYEG